MPGTRDWHKMTQTVCAHLPPTRSPALQQTQCGAVSLWGCQGAVSSRVRGRGAHRLRGKERIFYKKSVCVCA